MRLSLSSVAAWVVMVNAPFVLGHPEWDLHGPPILRSLLINLVLFIAPGLAVIGPRAGAKWSSWLQSLWVIVVSLSVFVGLLGVFQSLQRPVTPAGMWNATWLATNVLLLLRGFVAGPISLFSSARSSRWWLPASLFAASYVLFSIGATRVVPFQNDHDIDTQGPAYGLLTRMEPSMVTDRGTLYYFAHPLLFHFCVGGSFLYHDQMEHLEVFETITQRVGAASRGEPFQLPENRLPIFNGLRYVDHRVVAVSGTNYVVDPPLADGSRQMPLLEFELKSFFGYYKNNPKFIENRAPTLFFASLTVAILGQWAAALTGRWLIGLLVGLAYASSPEIFVRSSYGGFFAVSNYSILIILLAQAQWETRRNRLAIANCVLAGAFAALANHKLLLLPCALVAWEFLRTVRSQGLRSVVTASLHPVWLGFVLGTGLSWIHGFLIDAEAFWVDHIKYHILDRVIHEDALNYVGYIDFPTVFELWHELSWHTGHILLPLGVVSLIVVSLTKHNERIDEPPPLRMGSWIVWVTLTAVAFSIVDWRMTKHLMPLMIPLHLAPALWAGQSRWVSWLVGPLLAVLVIWNGYHLDLLFADFSSFPVRPGW